MSVKSFNYCALQFLNQWLEKESYYCELLRSSDTEYQREALIRAGGHFGVARNLPKSFERDNKRYQPIINALANIHEVDADTVAGTVLDFQKRISREYGNRNVLSLSSKFLWLKFKSPIRIYDGQARIALATNNGDYASFNDAFTMSFIEHREQILNACKRLKNVISYSAKPNIALEELENLVSKEWFQERVLDLYLWNKGRNL